MKTNNSDSKTIKSLFAILCIAFCITATAKTCKSTAPTDGKPTIIAANHPDIVYVGRFSFKQPKAPKMGWTACQIYASFTGTSISAIIKPGSGYFMAQIDDKPAVKIKSPANDSIMTIATGLSKGTHRIALTQCDEAILVKFPTFHGFVLDAGATLDGKPKMPTRRIEFIGNSITCALGVEDHTPALNGNAVECQNAYLSYAAETARRLDAQYQVVARSGIGVYRNNGGNKMGDTKVMPYYYPHALFSGDSEMWNFNRFQPDVVCINLGTNDTAQQYVITLLTTALTKFVKTLRGYYPQAKIILLSGTMRRGQRLADLTSSLDETVAKLLDEGISDIYRLDFTPADGSLGYGTGKHPSLKQHLQMADELTPFIQKIMGWE